MIIYRYGRASRCLKNRGLASALTMPRHAQNASHRLWELIVSLCLWFCHVLSVQPDVEQQSKSSAHFCTALAPIPARMLKGGESKAGGEAVRPASVGLHAESSTLETHFFLATCFSQT